MQQIDGNIFFEITQNFDFMPFTQSEGWRAFNSAKDENRFVFFVDNVENPQIACMGHVKKFAWLKMLQIEGECFADEKNIDSKKIKDFYQELIKTDFDIIEVNSSLIYNALYEIGIRQAGFLRPVGMFSMPLSILIDLQNKISYNRNWERNLKKAENFNLKFEIVENASQKDCSDFCEIFNSMSKRKALNNLNLQQVFALLNDKNFQLLFIKQNEIRIAGIIIFLNKNAQTAVGVFAASSQKALENHATFFMYDVMFQYLKTQKINFYDMARIAPSTHSKQSVFIFKNGVKGEYLLYCGEFSFYKRHIYRPLMYFVKKYLFKRIEV